jgi:hypothetical protein
VATAHVRTPTSAEAEPSLATLTDVRIVHFFSPTSERIAKLIEHRLDRHGVDASLGGFDRSSAESPTQSHLVLVFPIRGDDRIPEPVERWMLEGIPLAGTHSLCVTGDFAPGRPFDPLVADEATRLMRDRGSTPRVSPLLIDTPASDGDLERLVDPWVSSLLHPPRRIIVPDGPAAGDREHGLDGIREAALDSICALLPRAPRVSLDEQGNCVRLSLDDGARYMRSLVPGLPRRQVDRILDLVGELAHLRFLGLPFARLGAIRSTLPPALRVLDLRGNPTLDLSFMERTSSIEALNLADCDLEDVPPSLQAVPELRTLVIAKNRLRSVPGWFSGLRPLQRVTFYRNELTTLGPGLSGLLNLHLLNIGATFVMFANEDLHSLDGLETLGLRLLGLHELPAAVLRLPNLRHVDVSKNPLRAAGSAERHGITLGQGMPAWRWDDLEKAR